MGRRFRPLMSRAEAAELLEDPDGLRNLQRLAAAVRRQAFIDLLLVSVAIIGFVLPYQITAWAGFAALFVLAAGAIGRWTTAFRPLRDLLWWRHQILSNTDQNNLPD